MQWTPADYRSDVLVPMTFDLRLVEEDPSEKSVPYNRDSVEGQVRDLERGPLRSDSRRVAQEGVEKVEGGRGPGRSSMAIQSWSVAACVAFLDDQGPKEKTGGWPWANHNRRSVPPGVTAFGVRSG